MTESAEALPELNVEMLYRVLDHIEARPQDWNQATWGGLPVESDGEALCGTTACFAGHTAILSGAEFPIHPTMDHGLGIMVRPLHVVTPEEGEHVRGYSDYIPGVGWFTVAGTPVSVRAARLLGLTYVEVDALFFSDASTTEELRAVVDDIARGAYRAGDG